MEHLKETILNSDEYCEFLLLDLDAAKNTINMETYIYDDGYFGSQVAKALANAASRQVKIRLLVDGFGTPFFPKAFETLKADHISVHIFHPVPWYFWQLNYTQLKASFLFKFIYFFSTLNRRNHRKTCVIDNQIVYIGSANITQKHLSKKLGGEGWNDTVVRLENVDPEVLSYAFDMAWHDYAFYKRMKMQTLNPIFRLNYTMQLRRRSYRFLLEHLVHCKNRIWVTSPYFNPNYFILKQLIKAAKRGVDVKIILTGKTDVKIMTFIARNFYKALLSAKVNIYEYTPCVLHSKILIVDDWYSVGSSNLNHRSLRHDLEIDVTLQTSEGKKILEEEFLNNLKDSNKIQLAIIKKQSFFSKLFTQLLLYGKYFF